MGRAPRRRGRNPLSEQFECPICHTMSGDYVCDDCNDKAHRYDETGDVADALGSLKLVGGGLFFQENREITARPGAGAAFFRELTENCTDEERYWMAEVIAEAARQAIGKIMAKRNPLTYKPEDIKTQPHLQLDECIVTVTWV